MILALVQTGGVKSLRDVVLRMACIRRIHAPSRVGRLLRYRSLHVSRRNVRVNAGFVKYCGQAVNCNAGPIQMVSISSTEVFPEPLGKCLMVICLNDDLTHMWLYHLPTTASSVLGSWRRWFHSDGLSFEHARRSQWFKGRHWMSYDPGRNVGRTPARKHPQQPSGGERHGSCLVLVCSDSARLDASSRGYCRLPPVQAHAFLATQWHPLFLSEKQRSLERLLWVVCLYVERREYS